MYACTHCFVLYSRAKGMPSVISRGSQAIIERTPSLSNVSQQEASLRMHSHRASAVSVMKREYDAALIDPATGQPFFRPVSACDDRERGEGERERRSEWSRVIKDFREGRGGKVET